MGLLDERASLSGKVAVVVGGGGGLGRACALDLRRAGVNLELVDRDPDALGSTVGEAREIDAGRTATVHGEVLDARDGEALERFFAGVSDRHDGRLDVLFNVVGGTFRQPFTESTPKGWDVLVRTNFTWLLQSVHSAVPLMTSGGSIVNFTSIEAHRAAPGFAVYGAMKAAVASLTRTLAVELGPLGIRVNALACDAIFTQALGGLAGERGGEGRPGPAPAVAGDRSAIVPLGREGTFEDVGNCALFLASDLSSYVTGTTMHPDGGALAGSGWWREPNGGYSTRP